MFPPQIGNLGAWHWPKICLGWQQKKTVYHVCQAWSTFWRNVVSSRCASCDHGGRIAFGIHSWFHSNKAQRVVLTTDMNPALLLSVLSLLNQIPVPCENEALDCAPWAKEKHETLFESVRNPFMKWVCTYLQSLLFPNLAPEVEVCAGEANLSRALCHCGLKTKAFDDS